MNNFNLALTIVQKHCADGRDISGFDKFDEIAMEIGIPTDRLIFYLDCLERIDLVHYSEKQGRIILTHKGKNALAFS